jgi:hypothetical protein
VNPKYKKKKYGFVSRLVMYCSNFFLEEKIYRSHLAILTS